MIWLRDHYAKIQRHLMSSPKVSVIIPVYNCGLFLSECLDPVVSQTLRELEIILVDDASNDESPEIMRKYAERDDRIVPVGLTRNSGASSARNAGIERARGDYLIFLDADDYWNDSDMLAYLYETAYREQADIVTFGMEILNIRGKGDKRVQSYRARTVDLAADKSWRIPNFPCINLISRNMFEGDKVCFDPELLIGEDALFNITLFGRASRWVAIDKVYYCHRSNNPASITHATGDPRKLLCTVIWFERAIEVFKSSPTFAHRPDLLQDLISERMVMFNRNLLFKALKVFDEEQFIHYIGIWRKCLLEMDKAYFDSVLYPHGWPDPLRKSIELINTTDITRLSEFYRSARNRLQ